jgi:AraC-like DNA-binding protein
MQKDCLDTSRIIFINTSNLLDVRVVLGFDMINTFPRHVHDTFCIGLVTNGTRIIKHSTKSYYISENNLFLINPGESHACGSATKQGHSYQVICIGCEHINKVSKQIMDKDTAHYHFHSPIIVDTLLGRKIRSFAEILKQDNPLMEQETVLMDITSRLLLQYSVLKSQSLNIPMRKHVLKRVCEYIHDNFMENISLQQLAGIANLSPFHMQRSFLKVKGVTPHEYLMQLRIKKALDLLLNGSRPIETAYKTGFADQSHFSRAFKSIIGITPGKFISCNK